MNDASLPADHSCLAHSAAPTVGVIADTAVKQAAVIPDDGLPRFPRVTKYLLGFRCVFQEHVEQFAALGSGHSNDRSRMRADIEILESVFRVDAHQRVHHWRQ